MAIVVDDSFKRPGTIPFSWEIRPGLPKTRFTQPGNNNTTLLLLHPPKKLSPLRLKPLSHSQPLYPPELSPPSSSFISKSKIRPLSPLTTPSFSTPSKLKPPPPSSSSSSQSGFYSPGPSFRSSPRALSERWQLQRHNRVRTGSESERRSDFDFAGFGCFPTPKFRSKKKNKTMRKIGSLSERGYCSDLETMSPWNVSSRRLISPMRWDSPKSSFSSLRFSPRIVNEAELVGFGLF
ncbi:unnamed protein product [Cochlearia groenlandica]